MADPVQILIAEIGTDPGGEGYAGMTAAQILAALLAENKAYTGAITGGEIYNAIDRDEYTALSAADKATVDHITLLGDRISVTGGLIKQNLLAIFTAGSVSRANLLALKLVSRAAQLGIPNVKLSQVIEAKAVVDG